MNQDLVRQSSSLSFRDPGGRLLQSGERILRVVTEAGLACLDAYSASPAIQRLISEGRAVAVQDVEAEEAARYLDPADSENREVRVVEHDRIDFPSLPYEWCPEMLHEAGLFTIDLAIALSRENLGLKDATPFNILFRGTGPVFVDALSVEKRLPGDSTWLAYAQFIRTFLLPLMANRDFGWSMSDIFLTRRDGLEPEDLYRMAGPLRRWSRAYFTLVTMPTRLAKRSGAGQDQALYERKLDKDPERARYILQRMLEGLRKQLLGVSPRLGKSSTWSGYMAGGNNYSQQQFEFKDRLVGELLSEHRPSAVLDVGCNTGHFSLMAAKAGARVVAIDYDPVVVGQVWRAAREQASDVLPLVVNLARPTPAIGWRNAESQSFLDRAEGAFDLVLMLAVLHHMLVTERVPLEEVIDQAAKLTTNLLLIEYVGPGDSMFRRLVRGREHLHQNLSEGYFEETCLRRFQIVKKDRVPGSERTIYLLRRRA